MGSSRTCPFTSLLWCCGGLHSASISVAVFNLIAVILFTAFYLESEVFSLEFVAVGLVALFLLSANILLLHGVVQKLCWLLLPWLVLHFGALLGALLLCFLKYRHHLMDNGLCALAVLSFSVEVYFFVLILLHFLELRQSLETSAPQHVQENMFERQSQKNDCLIDLELEEKPDNTGSDLDLSSTKDDTFTQLASRFAVAGDTSQTKSLPTPDEVIPLTPNEANEETTAAAAAVSIPRRNKSTATLDNVASQEHPLLPSKSDSKILQVETNFSPYRSKSAAHQGPKMKVFLPTKNSSDEDDDVDDSSSSDEDKTLAAI